MMLESDRFLEIGEAFFFHVAAGRTVLAKVKGILANQGPQPLQPHRLNNHSNYFNALTTYDCSLPWESPATRPSRPA